MGKIIKIATNTENKKEDKPKGTLTEKVGNITGGIEISKSTVDILSKIGIYSANYFPELLSNLYNAKTAIGNAYGAIGYATLDVLVKKNKKFKRLAKFGGYLWYIGEGVYDLTSALIDQENIGAHLANFALDVSMAYQLGKDMSSLYGSLGKSKKDTKSGVGKDLEEIVSFIKETFKSKKETETETTSEKSKGLGKYLSDFGKNALRTIELGVGVGYGLGKSAFEKIKENYNIRAEKAKERKKIENEEKAKAEISSNKNVSLEKKKEVLKYCGKNPGVMRKYKIEEEYNVFKQKPIKEQINIIKDKKNSLNDEFNQMKQAPWIERINNSIDIFNAKLTLKKIEKILHELDIEEKNQSNPINKYL